MSGARFTLSRWAPAWTAIATAMLRFPRSKIQAITTDHNASSAITFMTMKTVGAVPSIGVNIIIRCQSPQTAPRISEPTTGPWRATIRG